MSHLNLGHSLNWLGAVALLGMGAFAGCGGSDAEPEVARSGAELDNTPMSELYFSEAELLCNEAKEFQLQFDFEASVIATLCTAGALLEPDAAACLVKRDECIAAGGPDTYRAEGGPGSTVREEFENMECPGDNWERLDCDATVREWRDCWESLPGTSYPSSIELTCEGAADVSNDTEALNALFAAPLNLVPDTVACELMETKCPSDLEP